MQIKTEREEHMQGSRYHTHEASMTDLRYEYREWLNANNLPKMSAETLLRHKRLTREQESYLKEFIVRWVSSS